MLFEDVVKILVDDEKTKGRFGETMKRTVITNVQISIRFSSATISPIGSF